MYTVEQTPVGNSCEGNYRPDKAGIQLRHRQEKEDGGTRRCRYPFLTVPFARMPPRSVVKGCRQGEEYELISQENYAFLRDSYLRYANLSGNGGLPFSPCGNVGEDIAKLYKAMDALVGDDIGVNLEQNEGRLNFRLWKGHRWDESTMYYFPVKFIEDLNPDLRRISVTFIHDLMHGNGMNTVLDCHEFEYVAESFSVSYAASEEAKEQARLCRSYKEGKIGRLLRRVGSKRYYRNLVPALDRYVPQNGYEKDLLDLMREGIQFLYPAKPLLGYAYDPYFRENPEFDPIGLESQVMVVYDVQDSIVEYLIDHYNSYYPETYAILPMEILDLSPDTDRLFSMDDDYPTRFFMWADRFIECITS